LNDVKSQSVINTRRKNKEALIAYKGGKCEICGYDKNCHSAYHFHHLDSTVKDFSVSNRNRSLEKLKKEADKCILLCANCHAEEHDKYWNDLCDTNNKFLGLGAYAKEPARKEIPCPVCGTKFYSKDERLRFCSIPCYKLGRVTKLSSVSMAEIVELKKTLSNTDIARMYDVSEAAIRKFLKRNNLS